MERAFSSPRNPIVDHSASADARFTIPSNFSFTRFFMECLEYSDDLLISFCINLYQSNNLFLINLISQRHLKEGKGILAKGDMCC